MTTLGSATFEIIPIIGRKARRWMIAKLICAIFNSALTGGRSPGIRQVEELAIP
jgi:hypothetical protein